MWVKNLIHDPKVAISAQDEGIPFGAVVIREKAEVTTEESQGALDEALKITSRYVSVKKMEAYVQRFWPQVKTIVKIDPGAVTSWEAAYTE